MYMKDANTVLILCKRSIRILCFAAMIFLLSDKPLYACNVTKLEKPSEISTYETKLSKNMTISAYEQERLNEFNEDTLKYETLSAILLRCDIDFSAYKTMAYSDSEARKMMGELEDKWGLTNAEDSSLEYDRVISVDGYYELDLEHGEYNFE